VVEDDDKKNMRMNGDIEVEVEEYGGTSHGDTAAAADKMVETVVVQYYK